MTTIEEKLRRAYRNAIRIERHLKRVHQVKGIRIKKALLEDEVEYITSKFSNLMKTRDTNIIYVDKIYLNEIIAKSYLEPNRLELRNYIYPYLKQKGFTFEDKGDKLKISFFKS